MGTRSHGDRKMAALLRYALMIIFVFLLTYKFTESFKLGGKTIDRERREVGSDCETDDDCASNEQCELKWFFRYYRECVRRRPVGRGHRWGIQHLLRTGR